jgi:hypothetical protein
MTLHYQGAVMRRLMFVFVVALLPAIFLWGRSQAESRRDADEIEFPPDPLAAKALAKARFELSQAKEQDLAKAKLAAALEGCHSRFKQFIAGRGTMDFTIDSAKRLLAAELELADTPAAVLAAHERHWAILFEMDLIAKARFEAGRIDITDYSETQYYRLDAELQIVRLKAKMQQK